jgi:ribosome-associated protein
MTEKAHNHDAPRKRPLRQHTDQQILDFSIQTARLVSDRHAGDVLLLDVRAVTNITDYLVIGTGQSDRQIKGLADEIENNARDAGLVRLGTDVDARASWIVVDLADIMIHLFSATARAHYDLEMLWGDAPRIAWQREPKK